MERKKEQKKDTRTQFEKDLDGLSRSEPFARLVKFIYDEREKCIAEMHDVPTDSLQQLAGRILAANDLLEDFKWNELQKRHGLRLNLK